MAGVTRDFVKAVEERRIAPDGRQYLLWPDDQMPPMTVAQTWKSGAADWEEYAGRPLHYTVGELFAELDRQRPVSHVVGYPAHIFGH